MAITIIMIIGAVFIGIFTIPNLVFVIKTKNTNGINLWMYIIFTLACIAFCIYGSGIVLDSNLKNFDRLGSGLPILISNVICVIVALITLTYKIINIVNAKINKMSEFEYWEKHLKK